MGSSGSCPPAKLTSSKVWVVRDLRQRSRNSVRFWQGNKKRFSAVSLAWPADLMTFSMMC
eukprot:1159985-Pelagomonas_calceolata.AAC.9